MMKRSKTYVISAPKWENKRNGAEAIFEEIMPKNFPKLKISMKPQF